jgi:hypothetical protein
LAVTQLFNALGLPTDGDPRMPDIIVKPDVGVPCSVSSKRGSALVLSTELYAFSDLGSSRNAALVRPINCTNWIS